MSSNQHNSSASSTPRKLRLGIVGFGALGQYLYRLLVVENNQQKLNCEIVFIWNRSPENIFNVSFPQSDNTNSKAEEAQQERGSSSETRQHKVPKALVVTDMAELAKRPCDILLEVCHPDVLASNIELWLRACCRAVYVGSCTGFSSKEVLARTLELAERHRRQIFVPAGALWGIHDIAKMGARRTIGGLHVTMKKPAASTRLVQPLQQKIEDFVKEEEACNGDADKLAKLPNAAVIFDGPVGELCPLAPNNVNTMAAAALASGPEVGFENARGTFVIERDSNVHVVEIEVTGKLQPGFAEPLKVKTERVNPCAVGAVTGMATYTSFYSSLVACMSTMRAENGDGDTDASAETGLRFC